MASTKKRKFVQPVPKGNVVGFDYGLKPTNVDMPRDVITSSFRIGCEYTARYKEEFRVPATKQFYGDIFTLDLPSSDAMCQAGPIDFDSKISTNRVYDIDMICEMRTPQDQILYNNNDNQYTEATNNKLSYHGFRGGTAGDPDRHRRAVIIFVVSNYKKKQVGEFLSKFPDMQNRAYRFSYIDAALFDYFCNTVKPLYARLCLLQDTSCHTYNTFVYDVPNSGGSNKTTGFNPTAIKTSQCAWVFAEYHRRQDTAELTPTDTYAENLVVGTLSNETMDYDFSHALIKLYWKKEDVKAGVLYLQSLNKFQNPCSGENSFDLYGIPTWSFSSSAFNTRNSDSHLGAALTTDKCEVKYECEKLLKKGSDTNWWLEQKED